MVVGKPFSIYAHTRGDEADSIDRRRSAVGMELSVSYKLRPLNWSQSIGSDLGTIDR